MKISRKQYTTLGQRLLDFAIGLIGWFVLNGAAWLLVGVVAGAALNVLEVVFRDPATLANARIFAGVALSSLPLLINLAALVFFGFTRHWIALGGLTAFALALLTVLALGALVAGLCYYIMGLY